MNKDRRQGTVLGLGTVVKTAVSIHLPLNQGTGGSIPLPP